MQRTGSQDPSRAATYRLLGLLVVSGFAGIALEIAWFRLMDVGVKSTAYTFGTVL